jgi:uncharacterized glyoxalase superfamily protein PhnB
MEETPYGSKEYVARDLEGHLWSFGSYTPEIPGSSTDATG